MYGRYGTPCDWECNWPEWIGFVYKYSYESWCQRAVFFMDCAIRLGQLKNCQIMSANTCQKVGHRPSDHVHKRRKTTRPYVTEICETKTKTVVSVIYRGDNGNVMWTVLFILNHLWRLHVLKIVESQNMNLNVGTFCKCDSGDFFFGDAAVSILAFSPCWNGSEPQVAFQKQSVPPFLRVSVHHVWISRWAGSFVLEAVLPPTSSAHPAALEDVLTTHPPWLSPTFLDFSDCVHLDTPGETVP